MSKDHPILLKCPYCGETLDFKAMSKNNWCVEFGYLIIHCPLCMEFFKMKMEEKDG